MTLTEILIIIIIHWISDFIMQDEKWALGKSKNWSDLLQHTFTYSLMMFGLLGSSYYLIIGERLTFYFGFYFFLITFIFHTATDYITSRIVSRRFGKEEPYILTIDSKLYEPGDILDAKNTYPYIIMNKIAQLDKYRQSYKVKLYNSIPNFGAFSLIGGDQVLHYIQLFSTYYFLVKI